ncbi:hypothetical protein Paes_0528 [Prosthecochloris aestuarii DSM 271]|uniref:Uncharacterized protein n=1 Tax=Prosthecochloris aestuarii (strain DSM 271 / SK 413) TaxID=290512 RepID=B4S5I7_PROA2|nr:MULTISPECIES: hypothetical protein [Prosthecochloris]ACF45584.1 hypothetical protein Paes_0528 [Prosthecochloris aestuarii DSM 271]
MRDCTAIIEALPTKAALIEKFDIKAIDTVESDSAAIMAGA